MIRKYNTKVGEKRSATELVASDIKLLDGKGASEGAPLAADLKMDYKLVPF